jgi:hypothetical protein
VSAGSYSHAEISSSTNLVELHTGVYIEGGSGAQHEVDVAAIDAGAGISPVGHASLRWGFEAKLYAATLPLSIPRAVLGTAYDLKALSAYHHHGPPRLALVSSAPLSMTGRTLLAYKHYSHPRVPAAESVRIGRSWAVDSFVRQHLSRL